MGIPGLLPLLKSIQRPTELKKFAGSTLGVDAYGWLHRGAIACAVELAEGKPTRKFVDFAMHRVRMMKHFGVTPYLVFDGDFLPSKAATEESRAKRREENTILGLELRKAGRLSQSDLALQKAIDITPEMARKLIDELKKNNVPYIVAPYEADAQLVYLERQGLITGIISEDSDLLVFGAKRLLTKLDQYGQCIEINRKEFCAVREVCLTGWTDKEFRCMAILSGCDYLKGLDKIGLKTAHRMVRRYKTPEKVVRMLQFNGNGKPHVPEGYLDHFRQAELTFLYQRVFCPKKQEVVFLTEPDSSVDVEAMPFIGAAIEKEVARAIARGDVNPISREALVSPVSDQRSNARQRDPGLSTTSTSNAPLGRPIETYFQDQSATPPGRPGHPGRPCGTHVQGYKRIPLGAMDPNCFIIKPGQPSDAPQPPRVTPLPRPYLEDEAPASGPIRPYLTSRALRRSEPMSVLLGFDIAPPSGSSRRQTTALLSRESSDLPTTSKQQERGPSPRPSKKQRLCDDPLGNLSSNAAEKSKFFQDQKAGAKIETSNTIPMSEDSIEVALSGPHADKKQDSEPSPKETSPKETSTPKETFPAHGQTTRSSNTESGRSSLQRFSFAPAPAVATGSKRTVMVHGLPTPSSSVQKTSAASTNSARSLQTPLQRMASQAMQRGRSVAPATNTSRLHVAHTSATHTSATNTSRLHVAHTSATNTSRLHIAHTSATRSFTEPWVSPARVPLPNVDLAEIEALHKPCGSEDQMILDSDIED